jgi:hypothetical protein
MKNKTKEFFSNPPESVKQQLWHNMDTGNSSLIQIKNEGRPNQRVISRDVYFNGENRRARLNETTGKMSFNERVEVAAYLDGKPLDAKVPEFISKAKKTLYTPQLNNF